MSGNTGQMWRLAPVNANPPIPDGRYALVDGAGFALDDPSGAATGAVDQQPYAGANQQWTVTAVSGVHYQILSASGAALTGATTSAPLSLAAYTGAADQLWIFQPATLGYNVFNAQTGQALDENKGGGQGVNVLSSVFVPNSGGQVWNLAAK
jgi:hypothetical protein